LTVGMSCRQCCCFVRAGTPESVKKVLDKPHPPQITQITHHSAALNWEESLLAAEAAICCQNGDNRIQTTVQQLSPGLVEEEWQQVYMYDYH